MTGQPSLTRTGTCAGALRSCAGSACRSLPGSTWVRYDVVELRKVVKAVYIQPHPSEPDTFYYNRYV